MMEDEQDSILEAIQKVMDYAMSHMVKTGETPPQDEGEPAPEEEASEELPEDFGDEEAGEEPPPDEPKNSVLKRYDFAGRPPAPKAPETPSKFKKRR